MALRDETALDGFPERDPTDRRAFTVGSSTTLTTILLICGVLVWRASDGTRALHGLALLVAANGIDSLVLWQFPMHMRGESPTFSDTMRGVVASLTSIGVLAKHSGNVGSAYVQPARPVTET